MNSRMVDNFHTNNLKYLNIKIGNIEAFRSKFLQNET